MSRASGTSRPLRLRPDGWSIEILDQTLLPHREEWVHLTTLQQAVDAIATMQVRGAPLIGVTAAYGLCLALTANASDRALEQATASLLASRPTAVNLAWAVAVVRRAALANGPDQRVRNAYAAAQALAESEAAACRAIGDHGLDLIRDVGDRSSHERPVQILTHCNAGWLATMEYGTALAPVYRAHEEGIPVHVWVAETRPRNQGWLTAWELGVAGISHTVVADNASGHLLQRGEVDLVFVGTDRTTRGGDVCNKVGTCLRALAARDAGVPFYVAAPSSSIDWTITDGMAIPIEERSADEVTHVRGLGPDGRPATVQVAPPGTAVRNFAFDVTPARLVTGLITERGICAASEAGLLGLFPERQV